MRSSLYIAFCFFIVFLLPYIPYRTTEGNGVLIHSEGMLPSLFNFLIICIVILLTAIALTQFKFKQNFHGQLILKRQDLNLSQQLPLIIIWVTFILASQLLSNNYFYLITGLTPYFIAILGTFLVYLMFQKWYILKSKPDFFSIDGETIYFKSLFGKGKRQMKNLKAVSYNTKNNILVIQFQEGLENIKFHLADYKFNELQNIVEVIKQVKGDTIKFDKTLSNIFSQTK